MARPQNKLTTAFVNNLRNPGRYGDGGGLWLQVSRWETKSWLFRYTLNGKAREMGLGRFPIVSLAEARGAARLASKQTAARVDPIAARDEERQTAIAKAAKTAARITFQEAAERAIRVFQDEWRSSKHGAQWPASMAAYVYPAIGKTPVADVTTAHVESILAPIWIEKHETARRVRQRIERILGWASAAGHRPKGDNPADLKNIGPLLASTKKVKKVRHQPAMPYADVPAFAARLRQSDFISAKALEFTILTAVRTNEALSARWPEVDLVEKIWTIPGEHTKSGRPHRVPLSDRALALLAALPRVGGEGGYIFPGAGYGRPLSRMAMLELLRGMDAGGFTVHGFRSSFRDWAGEQTRHPREVAELALAHVLTDGTEAAYSRGDAIDKRRKLMDAWAGYCASFAAEGDNVRQLRRAAG